MEMYFTPSGSAVTDRSGVLAAFEKAGLEPLPEVDGKFWVVAFAGSRIFISFQEREGRLSFAALDIPMAEQDLGHRAFCTLEDLGWTAEEDVG